MKVNERACLQNLQFFVNKFEMRGESVRACDDNFDRAPTNELLRKSHFTMYIVLHATKMNNKRCATNSPTTKTSTAEANGKQHMYHGLV